MGFFAVWDLPQKLVSAAIAFAMLAGGVWWVDRKLEQHYGAKARSEMAEEAREASLLQKKSNEKAAKEFQAQQAKADTVLGAKLQAVLKYAKNLPVDAKCVVTPEFLSLYNASGRTN